MFDCCAFLFNIFISTVYGDSNICVYKWNKRRGKYFVLLDKCKMGGKTIRKDDIELTIVLSETVALFTKIY